VFGTPQLPQLGVLGRAGFFSSPSTFLRDVPVFGTPQLAQPDVLGRAAHLSWQQIWQYWFLLDILDPPNFSCWPGLSSYA
jgi:hypothetical protein